MHKKLNKLDSNRYVNIKSNVPIFELQILIKKTICVIEHKITYFPIYVSKTFQIITIAESVIHFRKKSDVLQQTMTIPPYYIFFSHQLEIHNTVPFIEFLATAKAPKRKIFTLFRNAEIK